MPPNVRTFEYAVAKHFSSFTGATTYNVVQRWPDGREIWACAGYDYYTGKPYGVPIFNFYTTRAGAEREMDKLIAEFVNLNGYNYYGELVRPPAVPC